MPSETHQPLVIVIGGGPAGLMAAETLNQAGLQVHVYDAMPSVGRKFLLAGKGGLNITHAESRDAFLSRYGARRPQLEPALNDFGADALRRWVHELGIETFVGSSMRVFPKEMKAAPLMRAWLHRLRLNGVQFHVRHRWHGWDGNGALRFATPHGDETRHADAVVLALGGGSWARLGSDGAWVKLLEQRGIAIAPLRPANCGFHVNWSEHLRTRFAGQPIKTVCAHFTDADGETYSQRGEFLVTEYGIEGSLIYALSARLRDGLDKQGNATLYIDLLPDKTSQQLTTDLARPRGRDSMATHLRKRIGLDGAKASLLREFTPAQTFADPEQLAAAIKAVPIPLIAPRPIDEAISSAGGVPFEALDEHLMLLDLPGVFCAGEMLDWEAPTGGYLLTACFASGRAAGLGALAWLTAKKKPAVAS